MRVTRPMMASVILAGSLAASPSPRAQTPAATPPMPEGATPGVAAAAPANPVVAKVDGQDIHLSDVQATAQSLPAELRGVPMQMLYPMLLDQSVDRAALTIAAKKQGLQNDPAVEAAMRRADDEVLQNALLSKDVGPTISDDAIKARYDRDYKDKPGEEEVHARHILVPNEADAKKIIAELKGGASFEELAKKQSTDPGAANGGDLGWFKRADMVPAFADAAFAMKPNEVSQTPVHTQFGWHVIKVEGTRTAPPQTLDQLHDKIRQQLIAEGVKKAVAQARNGLQIQEFNADGSPMPARRGEDPQPPSVAGGTGSPTNAKQAEPKKPAITR